MILPDKETGMDEDPSIHAVDIFAFVDAQEIPFHYFDTTYFLAPAPGGEKIYALLRETLRRTRKIGIAHVVIHMQQQLAALIPHGQSLILNTLRCDSESERKPCDILHSWCNGVDEYKLTANELTLVHQFIDSMSDQWEVQLPIDGLEDGVENAEPPSQASLCAPEIIRLENILGWSEELDEDVSFEPVKMLTPGPHRFPRPLASRHAAGTGWAGKHGKRIR